MAKRKATRGRRGLGSITERDGGYLARWSHTEGGKRIRTARTFVLRNDAEWWLAEARRHGEAPDDPLVSEWMPAWLASKRSIRASTREQYRNHVEDHIVPVLGGYRLGELRRRHIEAFVEDRLHHTSEKTKKPLSPATVGKLLVTLRTALEAAVPRTIPDNPAARVEAPAVVREPVTAMTPDAAVALLAAVEETWVEHITRFLLGSGLRIGEAVALNQGDVHEGWVALRQSKTTIRAVRISPDADAAIHDAIKAAPRRGRSEPVFFSPRPRRGGLPRDRVTRWSVSAALDRIAGVTAHDLRHGTATLMVRAGVPMRQVAEQLGHANPSLTARVYAHVSPDSLAEAVGTIDVTIARAKATS